MPIVTSTLRALWYGMIGVFGCILHIVLWTITVIVCVPLICLLAVPFIIVMILAVPMFAIIYDELAEPEEDV